jgi:hypothetical protein
MYIEPEKFSGFDLVENIYIRLGYTHLLPGRCLGLGGRFHPNPNHWSPGWGEHAYMGSVGLPLETEPEYGLFYGHCVIHSSIIIPGTEFYMFQAMNIQFKDGDLAYKGTATTVPKEQETQYFIDLGESLQFTIRVGENGWETDNPDIEEHIVEGAAAAVEDADTEVGTENGEIINEPEDVDERSFGDKKNQDL